MFAYVDFDGEKKSVPLSSVQNYEAGKEKYYNVNIDGVVKQGYVLFRAGMYICYYEISINLK